MTPQPDDQTQPLPAAPPAAPVWASAAHPAAEPTTDAAAPVRAPVPAPAALETPAPVVPDSSSATARPSWWAGRKVVAAGALVVGLCLGAAAGATTAVALHRDGTTDQVTTEVGPGGIPGQFPGGRGGRDRDGDGTQLPDGTQQPGGGQVPEGGQGLLPGGGGSTDPGDANGTAPTT